MELYKHQIEFLKQNPNKSCLVWSCGTGKTRTAIEWAKKTHSSIIICPKALKSNWIRECENWGLDGTRVLVVTKEDFRKGWDIYSGYSSIIVDEVHNGFLTPHFKSQMSKALRDYIKKHNVSRVLLLSATVYSSSPWNIYQLATLLGYKLNWQKFNYTFFDQVRMGHRIIPVAKKNIEKQLSDITKKIASVVDINDVMDVPLQNHLDPEYFSLNSKQRQLIRDIYDPLPIVRYTLQHEIENGVLIGNEYREDLVFECDKNERILSLVKESKKMAIVCRYNLQIDSIKDMLKDNGYDCLIIRGDVKDRDSITRIAENSKECVVLIQSDCAEGYELPSFDTCVFASMSYSYVKYEQVCGRFLRMNKPSRTTFVYLLTEGNSLDKAVYDSIKRKEDFNINLYGKNKDKAR